MKTPQERYDSDPDFRQLVDVMTHFVIKCEFSPSELREAAVLAAIRYETIHSRPVYLSHGGMIDRIDAYHAPQCTCKQPTRFGKCPVHEAS